MTQRNFAYAIAPSEADGHAHIFSDGPWPTLDDALAVTGGGTDALFAVRHNREPKLLFLWKEDRWVKVEGTPKGFDPVHHDLSTMAEGNPWARAILDQVEQGRPMEDVLKEVVPRLIRHNTDLERDLITMRMTHHLVSNSLLAVRELYENQGEALVPIPLLEEEHDGGLLPVCPVCGVSMRVTDSETDQCRVAFCATCLKAYAVKKEADDDTTMEEAPAPRHV